MNENQKTKNKESDMEQKYGTNLCECGKNIRIDMETCESCEETEQKTYDSEPATSEDMNRIKSMLHGEDISGGLFNIELPEGEVEKQKERFDYAASFIDINDVGNTPCYRTDQVKMKLTPEQLVILKEALETLSVNIESMEYLYTEKGMADLYEQQTYIRDLRNIVDESINQYVLHRPYSPFLPNWIRRIGKDDMEKITKKKV